MAQMRGGPPREMPMPRMPSPMEGRGRPDGVGRPADAAANGLAHAEAAQTQRLARVQRDKAEALARQFPDDYELDGNGALAVRGEVLAVNLSDQALATARRAGFTIVRQDMVEGLGLPMTVLTHPVWPLSKMVDKLRDIAPDAAIEADHIFSPSGATHFGGVAPEERDPGRGSNWRVGMIDTGVSSGGRTTRIVQQGFAPGGVVARAHGTAVADILARHTPDEPGASAAGTVFAADIFGAGRRGGTAELMVKALGWLVRQEVPVVNISMVGPYNGVVAAAISMVVKRGMLIVAPVGNDGSAARLLYPASLEGVIAVTGVDARGQLLPEASRVSRVDFAGPGVTAVRGMSGQIMEMRGTSFAAPVVAHRLAELLPAPEPGAARRVLRTMAETAWKPRNGRPGLGRGIIGMAPLSSR